MLGPYRDSGPIDVEPSPDPLPDACVTRGIGPEVCPRCRPAPIAPPPALPPAYVRAFSAACTLLLLVGCASLSALTWTVTSTILMTRAPTITLNVPPIAGRHADGKEAKLPTLPVQRTEKPAMRAARFATGALAHGPSHPAPPVFPQRSEAPPVSWPKHPWLAPPLAKMGEETHQADALWARAQQLAAAGAGLTLVRATVAPDTAASEPARILHGQDAGTRTGLQILDGAGRSAATLLGLRPGDRITTINGFSVRQPEQALAAYAQIARGRSAVVELVRLGKPVALRIDWAS